MVRWLCTNPAEHGHTDRWADQAPAPGDQGAAGMTEEQIGQMVDLMPEAA